MYNLINQPDDWSDTFSHQFITAWIDCREEILWEIWWLEKFSHWKDVKLTSRDFLRKIGANMPRKGRAQNATRGNTPPRIGESSHRDELKWLNIRLEADDLDTLEQSDATLEYLSACIVGLANDGFGISIKPVDKGESICCTIIGSHPDFDGVSYGLSSFAGNVRDALLVSLYKLDEKLGGTFNNADKFAVPAKQTSRFR